jgi:hypothetical protein
LKSSATAVSVPPRARPLREVELEAGRREHILADPLVLVRAAAGDTQAAEDGAVALGTVRSTASRAVAQLRTQPGLMALFTSDTTR